MTTRREQAPLNTEGEEREENVGEEPDNSEEKSTAEEKIEKLKEPTIGVGLIVLLTLNIVMLVVGIITIHDCPLKEIIPIYLIVAGIIGIVTKVTPILNRNKRLKVVNIILWILYLIEFIWMILGSVWIYGIYTPNYNPVYPPYCGRTAYLLAFWLLTTQYIILLILLIFSCYLFFAIICVGITLARRLDAYIKDYGKTPINDTPINDTPNNDDSL